VHSTMALNAVLVKGIMWYCNSVFPAWAIHTFVIYIYRFFTSGFHSGEET
jgi:hypothetical protein